MSDLIDRDAAIALPPYDGDGDPAGQFDHHIFVKLADLRALPAVEVGVKPELDNRQYYPQPARDDLAFAMFAGWLNCAPDKVPLEFKAWTCSQTRTAWGRVADAARKHIALTVTPAPDAGKVQALVGELQKPQCLRTCTTNGGPNTYGQSWVHETDYKYLRERADALCAALAAMKEG